MASNVHPPCERPQTEHSLWALVYKHEDGNQSDAFFSVHS